jgi:hypothetical protein
VNSLGMTPAQTIKQGQQAGLLPTPKAKPKRDRRQAPKVKRDRKPKDTVQQDERSLRMNAW